MTFELSDVWKQIVLVLSKQETEFHPMTKFGWGGGGSVTSGWV